MKRVSEIDLLTLGETENRDQGPEADQLLQASQPKDLLTPFSSSSPLETAHKAFSWKSQVIPRMQP